MEGIPNENEFWAKLDQDELENVNAWHPLEAHSADIAAVVEVLLKHTIVNKRIASLIDWESMSDVHIARLSALAAIHDAGKVNHGFQNKSSKTKRPRAGHVSPMIEVLEADLKYKEEILIPLGIQEMMNWFSSETALIHFLLATWAHHGRPVPPEHNFKSSLWKENTDRNPVKGLRKLGESIHNWFPDAFEQGGEPFPARPVLQHAFNGLLTLADWLGSDRKFFDFAEYNKNYIDTARKNASIAVKKLVLDTKEARQQLGKEPVGFNVISGWDPFEIQKACIDLPIHKEGSLTILESDTGSGKTEAAIARFVRLFQAGLVDGMYFALPTRSAASQLYDRVTEAVKRAFTNEQSRPPVVQAVSGYFKVDGEEGKSLPHFKVLWPDNQRDLLRERGWAAEHPKKYLAGAVVVGTIDQVLLSTLQVKHAHLRAAALLRHFLVVDEVHASDTYMTKLLGRVLDFHLSAGGHALLMSATLGTAPRYHLSRINFDDLPEPEEAKNIEYPLITHVSAERKKPEERHAPSTGRQKLVIPEVKKIADSEDQIARLVSEEAQKGARALIIRNLVKDCIATQQALEEHIGTDSNLLFRINTIPAPHHSRFAPDDRKRLDEEIEKYFGKETREKSVIAVATQTVEQSLDIDADLMITDLCPMDVLLQRIGRLHRHEKERPEGFGTARCVILAPEDRDLGLFIDGKGQGSRGKHGLGTVYQDLRTLEATWRVLEDEDLDLWQIPEHNRELVERATHPDILRKIVKEMGVSWETHQEHILGQEFADRQIPGLVGIDFDKPFGDTGFAEELEWVKTRLGRNDYQVFLPMPIEGPFGDPVEEITITEWQLNTAPEDPDIPEESIQSFEGGFSFHYYGKSFRYDRFGLTITS